MTHLLEQAGPGGVAAPLVGLCRNLQLPASRHAADPGRSAAREWPWHSSLPGRSRHRNDDALGVVEMGTSPSCLALNGDGTRLYSANETDRVGDDKQGTISAFAVNRADGKLELLNTVRSGGAGPDLCQRASGRTPPARGQLFRRFRRGAPDPGRRPAGRGLGRQGRCRHNRPHQGDARPAGQLRRQRPRSDARPHDSGRSVRTLRPSRRPGPGQDLRLEVRDEHGLLTPNDPPSVSLPPGDGPRHFHFHPNGRWFYSIQEEGSTVVLFDYDSASGGLTRDKQSRPCLPALPARNFCSEILVSGDGRFVYAGNRLHDSIAIFSVGSDGRLTFVGEEWTRGNYPRSFAFDPPGRFLYCCNQRGDAITVFRVDSGTGRLSFTGHFAAVGNPSMIVFLGLA